MNERSNIPSGVSSGRQTINVFHLVQESARALKRSLSESRISVSIDVPRGATVDADVDSFRHLVRALMTESIAAMPNGGELSITVWSDDRLFELEVADSRPQSFGGRSAPGGSSPISPTARQLAAKHGGTLIATNCPEGGIAVTLRVATAAARAAA